MLLSITNTAQPATDLGHLLRKDPARVHSFDLSFGRAHLFYPEATPERCTAALKNSGAKRVLDLGCGEGRLLQSLLKDKQFEQIVGMDVSYRALEIAQDRLNLDRFGYSVRFLPVGPEDGVVGAPTEMGVFQRR